MATTLRLISSVIALCVVTLGLDWACCGGLLMSAVTEGVRQAELDRLQEHSAAMIARAEARHRVLIALVARRTPLIVAAYQLKMLALADPEELRPLAKYRFDDSVDDEHLCLKVIAYVKEALSAYPEFNGVCEARLVKELEDEMAQCVNCKKTQLVPADPHHP